jgi:hypothetical protein
MSSSIGSPEKDTGAVVKRRRVTPVRAGIVLFVGSLVLTIALLEGAARLAVLLQYGQSDSGFYHIFKYEPFLGTRSNERFLATYPPKGSNYRVLILGGSTADQLSSVSQEVYAKLFSRLTTRPVEVVNFAQAGAISSQEAIMLARYGLRLRPDLVIAIDGANDVVAMTKGATPGIPYTAGHVRFAIERPFSNAIVAVGRHSQFINVLRKLRERREEVARQSDNEAIDRVDRALGEYLANQSDMEAMARGVGAKFVTVLQPYIHLRRSNTENERALPAMTNYAYRRDFMIKVLQRFRTALAQRERGATAFFIDSTYAFDGSSVDCFRDEVHLRSAGMRLLLDHVVNELARYAIFR